MRGGGQERFPRGRESKPHPEGRAGKEMRTGHQLTPLVQNGVLL